MTASQQCVQAMLEWEPNGVGGLTPPTESLLASDMNIVLSELGYRLALVVLDPPARHRSHGREPH